MKLLKIFGIVAGLHAFALVLIFANPGCSSSRSAPAAEPADAPKPEPTPTISAVTPDTAAPAISAVTPADSPAPVIAPATDAAPAAGAYYSPTRPGTPAAAALEDKPAVDVTPATTYSVGKGDSLWSIAKKNHLRVSVLAAANHLRVGTALRPGQKLLIPAKATDSKAVAASPAPASPIPSHAPAPSAGSASEGMKVTVHRGETLGTIAHRYHVSLAALAVANSISDPQKIRPGQELIIPGHGAGTKSGGAAAKSTAGTAAAPGAQIPAANQDLDAGLKTPPANPVPVIRIDPDAPVPVPAPKP